MSWGFEFRNDNNALVVTSEYRCLRSFSGAAKNTSASSLVDDGDATDELERYTVSHGGRSRPGQAFVHPHAGDAWVRYYGGDDSEANFQVLNGGAWDVSMVDEEGGVRDSGGWGLQVFDANGDPVLDSREYMMTLRDVVFVNPQNLNTGGDQIAHASASKPYYLLNGLHAPILDSNTVANGNTWIMEPFFRNVDGSTLEVMWDKVSHSAGISLGYVDARPDHWAIIVAELAD